MEGIERADQVTAMRRLRMIRTIHTAAWAVFAGCIVALPVASFLGDHRLALALALIVAVEVAILVINGMRCPLTAVAARYTDERSDNFDIYLPLWLARHNKSIFGSLYALGVLYALANWMLQR